jgi:hypothetical protein
LSQWQRWYISVFLDLKQNNCKIFSSRQLARYTMNLIDKFLELFLIAQSLRWVCLLNKTINKNEKA